jgi:transcriptional repressor NrdR
VMEGLKGLDDVAYVRFASVYKNFREASDFKALLGTLVDPIGSGVAAPATDTASGALAATVTPLRPKRQPKSSA